MSWERTKCGLRRTEADDISSAVLTNALALIRVLEKMGVPPTPHDRLFESSHWELRWDNVMGKLTIEVFDSVIGIRMVPDSPEHREFDVDVPIDEIDALPAIFYAACQAAYGLGPRSAMKLFETPPEDE